MLRRKKYYLTVEEIEYVSGYVLRVTFSNSRTRIIDFSSSIREGRILSCVEDFRDYASIDSDGFCITWQNERGCLMIPAFSLYYDSKSSRKIPRYLN